MGITMIFLTMEIMHTSLPEILNSALVTVPARPHVAGGRMVVREKRFLYIKL